MTSRTCATCQHEKPLGKFIKHGAHWSNSCYACVTDQNSLERRNKEKREELAAIRRRVTKAANLFAKQQSSLTADEILERLAELTELVDQMKRV
jgi:hypothetical protein